MQRSIKTQSLIYFMVLIAVTIAMLWLVQEWFFSTQFKQIKKGELIRSVERYSANFDYELDDYNTFISNLSNVSDSNGIMIYCLAFKGQIKTDELNKDSKGRKIKYFEGEVLAEALITPFSSSKSGALTSLETISSELHSNLIYLTGVEYNGSSATKTDDQSSAVVYGSYKKYSNCTFFVYVESLQLVNDISSTIYRLLLLIITLVGFFLALLFSLLLSRLFCKPISKLSVQAQNMSAKDYETPFTKGKIRELNKLVEGLNLVSQEFYKTEQLRRDFLANITHDFRTPLTLIRGYAELLRDHTPFDDEVKSGKQKKNAQVIVDESVRLANLVDDIQRLSKIQAGTDSLNITDLNIGEFLKSLIGQFAIVNIKYGCPIEFVNDIEPDTLVSADSEKIALVMYNLITNAINYANKVSPRVSVVLRKHTQMIEQKSKPPIIKKFALIEVIDNGKGIPQEEINSVWERFYRSSQKKRTTVGSGLGLSIVKSIFELHNANYGINSQLNQGTTFWFMLNITTPPPNP